MVQLIMSNQYLPLFLSQDILGGPQLGHVLPIEVGS